MFEGVATVCTGLCSEYFLYISIAAVMLTILHVKCTFLQHGQGFFSSTTFLIHSLQYMPLKQHAVAVGDTACSLQITHGASGADLSELSKRQPNEEEYFVSGEPADPSYP